MISFDVGSFLTNQFVLMFATALIGIAIGRLRIGRFQFGISGCLFIGLAAGWFVYMKYAVPFKDLGDVPNYASRLLNENIVSKQFFIFSLILFIASVGLLAGRNLKRVLKSYGLKFIALGFLITFTGASVCYGLTVASKGYNPFLVSGVYTGSLTSSPGLAAALEAVGKYGRYAEAQVGLGHAIGYVAGVLVVILFIQFFPPLFGIDIRREKLALDRLNEAEDAPGKEPNNTHGWSTIGFLIVCSAGYFLGSVKIYLGPVLKYFQLGTTGGVLIAALVFGYIGNIGKLGFRMDSRVLNVIREISLALFLAIIGLNYGYVTVDSIREAGIYLLFVSFICSFVSIAAGFFLGRFVFKLNWAVLAGALCGGMTSTPGLGVALEITSSEDTVSGYGATYPFALIGMVFFTIMLHNLPM